MTPALLATLAACSPSPPAQTAPPSGPAATPLIVARTTNGTYTFDPAEHRADDVREEAERIIRQIPPPPETPPAARDTATVPTDTTWITVEGYRVQVYLSTTREQADAAAERARQRFPSDSVYVVFQAPWHKVRVGDCRTWQEVTAKVEDAKSRGYADAFPVPSTVRVIRGPDDRVAE